MVASKHCDASFHALPALERRKRASELLESFRRIRLTLDDTLPPPGAPLKRVVAWVAVCQDVDESLRFWRRQMHIAAGAGRSPAIKGQGRPALDSGAGSAAEKLSGARSAGSVSR